MRTQSHTRVKSAGDLLNSYKSKTESSVNVRRQAKVKIKNSKTGKQSKNSSQNTKSNRPIQEYRLFGQAGRQAGRQTNKQTIPDGRQNLVKNR